MKGKYNIIEKDLDVGFAVVEFADKNDNYFKMYCFAQPSDFLEFYQLEKHFERESNEWTKGCNCYILRNNNETCLIGR